MPLRIALVTIAALAASPAAGTPGPASQPSASAQPDPLWQEVVLVVKQMVDEAHENGAPVKDEHGCPDPANDRCGIDPKRRAQLPGPSRTEEREQLPEEIVARGT